MIVVVLPAPLGPTSANALPSATQNSSPFSASNRPYSLPQIVDLDNHLRLTSRRCGSRLAGEPGPPRLDGVDDVLQLDTDAQGFDDQLLDFVLQQPLAVAGAGRRPRGHDRADAGLHLEPAFLNQMLNDLVRRVGMDLQLGRERADRGKGLAGLKLAADKRLGRGEDDLVEDGLPGPKREPEQCHTSNVTHVTVGGQSVSKTDVKVRLKPDPTLSVWVRGVCLRAWGLYEYVGSALAARGTSRYR